MKEKVAKAQSKSRKPRLYSYRIRKSPYFEATERYGCRAYTTYNNMYLPLVYQDLVSDYWHLKKGVTLWDVGCQRQVEITGPDAFKFLQRLTPRNLTSFKIGQCKYVVLTTEDGGILNDPVALRLGENHFWLSVADRDILLWAKALAIGFQMQITIREPDVSPLAVQGPKSFDVVADLFGDWVRTLRYYWFQETELNGIPFVLARSGWSKQGGYELYLRDGSFGDQLWEIVMEAGRPHNIKPATPCWIERIESGLLNYWDDMDENTNPYEVGLGKFVDLDQEVDFIGKEALKGIRAAGIKRKLVGLEIHSEPFSGQAEPWSIECKGLPVGAITSAVYSPDLDKNIALAMVSIGYADARTELVVNMGQEKAGATVTPLPFIDNRAKVWHGIGF
ncbi:MAG: dimethylsulfoniopropionate demethylase [Anaerolineaceae bacterium]|nr:MAG: dimethylsulfoniopropionate demethylase [Anaerolineaceae bacterium]